MAPDGSQHAFYPTLHDGETVIGGRQYTRDGTYIRLRGLYANGTQIELDFPNGQTHVFQDDGQNTYRLIRIQDPFGNYLNVTYTFLGDWDLHDNFGRTHHVYFSPSVHYPLKVARVELTLPNGTTGIWDFSYQNTLISRGCPDNDPQTPDLQVPLLTRVRQPDGTFWDMPVGTSYFVATGQACSDLAGRIKGVTLPTRGRIDWTYRSYIQTAASPCEAKIRSWLRGTMGVGTRTVSSGQASGTWTYGSKIIFQDPPAPNCNPPRTQITRVMTPLGHIERNYFSIFRTGTVNVEGWRQNEYGLPFTRATQDGTGRFLSREVYEGCDPDLVTGCLPQRSFFVRYEQDRAVEDDEEGSLFNLNSRVAGQRTRYDDDSGKLADVDYSAFDGFGHYRIEQTGGTFPGENRRRTFINYNPEAGTYNNGGGGTFAMRGPFEPWELETYTERTMGEGGGSGQSKEQYCFERDGATNLPRSGFLERKRVYLDEFGASPASQDLVTVYQRDGSGNLIREDSYGGNKVPLNTSANLCSATYTNPQYGMLYQPVDPNGAGRTTQPTDLLYRWRRWSSPTTSSGAAFSFLSSDETVDPNTGLTISSRDTAGLETTYTYDLIGRLTSMLPVQEARTDYVYSLPTDVNPNVTPQVQVLRKSGAVTLAESRYQYDGLGRPWREQRRIPNQGLQVRETLYDGMGHPVSVSELGSTTKKTESLDFDPFGRPRRLRLPDGHETQVFYGGERSVTRRTDIGTTWTGTTVTETTATVEELHDRFGRLHSVKEASGPLAAPDVVTSYTYDSAGRLNRVSTPSAGVTQVRIFSYDNRAFLLSETHPEKVGAVTYSGYDARGHVGQKVDGPNTLAYTYDRAERLTEVREVGQGNRLLKSLSYAGSNSGCGWCNGKLSQASRWNYVTIGSTPFIVEIRELLQYNGIEGRMSNRTTQNYVSNAPTPNEAFTFSQTYTPLGLPLKITYPQCQHTACTNQAPRSADFSYTDGQLTAVTGTVGTAPVVPTSYAGAITYHVNGMVNQVVHQNSSTVTVTDTTALDPNGMARPASITAFRGTTSLWNTGGYSYDGAGNIKRIGSSYFTYDKVSRLNASSLNVNPGISTPLFKEQSYVFDAFGNILSITTNGLTVNTPTNSATNRLDVPSVYDTAGNLTLWQSNTYEYDALNMMRRYRTAAGLEWADIYNVDDERVWTYKTGGTESRWFLRGFDSKVLREYTASSAWQVANDYIYRDSQLLASETPAGVRHYHLDHLGTPRLVTDSLGTKKAFHAYYPFGQEATVVDQDAERMKFTGHERDLGNPASDADDLDYMHARFSEPLTGRFLSTDPSQGSQSLEKPQSWNRYTYALGNPLKFVDPDGKVYLCKGNCPPADPKTFGEWLEKAFFDAQFLPGPGALEVAGEEVAVEGGRALLRSFSRTLKNIFAENLDEATVTAAGRELAGEVVATKGTGQVFDHVAKFRSARDGVVRVVNRLKNMASDMRLSPEQRTAAQSLLSEASKKLDRAEALLKKAYEAAAQRTLDALNHPLYPGQ
ncbi:MAG TPA: polymorphic toxin type 28 domain-containing protein [Thermoanaerobaculia bacterium]|nr:polymorphic toxin type 28 domain-containing protein [Thermoanaerobaculia bacterium]